MMNYNRTPDEWSKVNPDDVASGSWAQARNVLEMALQDIARMAIERKGITEQCAKTAEKTAFEWLNGEASTPYGQAYQNGCRNSATAIRALNHHADKPEQPHDHPLRDKSNDR